MLKSDRIELLTSYWRIQGIGPYRVLGSVVDFQTAASVVSERMSQNVKFVVKRADLVYAQEHELDERGNIVKGESMERIYPCYRFELSNTNDSKTYICYVDVEDGENFNYYYITNSAE